MAQTQVSGSGIKDNVVTNSHLHSAANIASSKLADSGVTAGSYGSGSATLSLTINSKGIITAASTNAITQVGGSNGVDFNDNVKARFGTGNDFEIFFDGTNTTLYTGTGDITIQTAGDDIQLLANDDIQLKVAGGVETSVNCIGHGATELYYDNSKKLETTTDGVQVTGEVVSGTLHCSGKLDLPDSPNATVGRVLLGDSDDLQIYHDGNDSYIDDAGVGSLLLRTTNNSTVAIKNSSANMARFLGGDAVELYHNNSKKFETRSNGIMAMGSSGDVAVNIKVPDTISQSRIIFSDATNTDGIITYDHNDRKMHLGAGTASATDGDLTIDSSGNVSIVGKLGINDTSPDHEIDIETASPQIRLEETSTGGSKRLDLGVSSSGQAFIAANQSASSIEFETTGARRFTINANGTINSQASSSGSNLSTMSGNNLEEVHNQFSNSQTYSWNSVFRNHAGGYGIEIKVHSGSSSREGLHIYSTSDSQSKASILMNGGYLSRADDYAGYSDIKLKENIVDAQSQWNDVKAIKVRNFNFKDNPSQKLLGVVAQELETVCPNLIHNLPDKETDKETGELKETGTITKAAKYSILHMKAFKALQEAMARIEILETKVAALEAS